MIKVSPDYIVQGLRFEIFEELGCNYAVYPSGVTVLLVYAPPLLLCTACLAYYIRKLLPPICMLMLTRSSSSRTRVDVHLA